MRPFRILLVEDDPAVLTLTRDLLLKERFEVEGVGSIRDAKARLGEGAFDLLVLDLGLPDGDGLTFCRSLKSGPATQDLPVFILTARGSSEDIVNGLEAGADDYLPKPFNEREFMARARAILRRKGDGAKAQGELISGALRLSPESHETWCQGKPVALTLREFEILQALLSNPGKALSREQIVALAWGPSTAIVPKVVDVHLGHLRSKLGVEGKRIETVPQVGYRFAAPKK
jgi:two-component system alkaline phosphatase synthesis response regulator PhoP